MSPILHDESGHILLSSLVFLVVTTVVGFAFLSSISDGSFRIEYSHRELKALWAAEEAVTRAFSEMNHAGVHTFKSGYSFTRRSDSVFCSIRPDSGSEYQFIVEATVFNGNKGNSDTVQQIVVLAGPGPSSYMSAHLWYARKAGKAYFSGRDILDAGEHGLIVCEEVLNVIGTPRFHGDSIKVAVNGFTQVVAHARYGGKPFFDNEPRFMNESYQFSHMSSSIKSGADFRPVIPPGRVAEITFMGKKFRLRYRDKPETVKSPLLGKDPTPVVYSTPEYYMISDYKGMYFTDDVEVKGVVDGRITIGSAGNILLTGDILYEGADPVTGKPDRGSSSVLGLIAGKNIALAKPQEEAIRDGGIIVSAGMIAADSSLLTQNAFQGHMGTMTLWGSLVERVHGTIGYIQGFDLGYTSKRWYYDDRLKYLVPPFYPPLITESGKIRFEKKSWKRKY